MQTITGTLNIVLADDHEMVRKGIRRLLEVEPDFIIVGEASGGTDAVKLVEKLHPDVLVTDLKMPDLGGIEVTKQVRQLSPSTQVVVLSMFGDGAYVEAALHAGARGYVPKDSSADDLVKAIREVADGNLYLSPSLEPRR
jgi:DNA-binding NarL/FixJ family response regulator